MAVATIFHNWQQDDRWDEEPYEQASPNLLKILEYLVEVWGGTSLGIHGDRNIRSGQSPSSHSFGAALDWRWGAHEVVDRPVSRDVLDNEVLPFLIMNSAELGIQAIHDQGRIWRANRSTPNGGGWRKYDTGYGEWLHIEVNDVDWDNDTPVTDRLADAPAPTPEPEPEQPAPWPEYNPPTSYSLWPLNPAKPVLKDTPPRQTPEENRDAIRYLQAVLKHECRQRIVIDGWFGSQTELAVRNLQQFFGLQIDGIVGRKETWPVVDWLTSL